MLDANNSDFEASSTFGLSNTFALSSARGILWGAAVAAVFQASGVALAQPPSPSPAAEASATKREAMWNTPAPTHYRILAKPTHPHSKSPIFTPEVPLPKIESQSVQPYAYGWFGARTLPNASRHFGYRSTYTQWTIK